MTKALSLVAVLFLAIMASPLYSEDRTQSEENPLIEEMLLLDTAFREIVSAVALSDGERVLRALEPMHGTMEKTHEGVQKGTVKILRNAHRMEDFVRMDTDFHHNLEELAEASRRNDAKQMLSLTKKALDACVECHQTFGR